MEVAQREMPNIVFVGVRAPIAHAPLHCCEASRRAEQPEEETTVDVFGVGRRLPPVTSAPAGAPEPVTLKAGSTWKALLPGEVEEAHVAPETAALVCSGLDDSHRQLALEAARAGKSVFIESLERFTTVDVAELSAAPSAAAALGSPPASPHKQVTSGPVLPAFIAGLYLRFDRAIWLTASTAGGLGKGVGRPLLYQAQASVAEGSLFDLGMMHVGALRLLLGCEPSEVHCMGVPGPIPTPANAPATPPAAAATGSAGATQQLAQQQPQQQQPAQQQWFTEAEAHAIGVPASQLGACAALVLSLRMESGVLATISLDRVGGFASQRVQVLGDQGRVEFNLEEDLEELQQAGVNHFLEHVLSSGTTPPRMSAQDCLRAHTIMLAAAESLHSGQPEPVSYGGLSVLAGRTAAVVGTAAERAAAAVEGAIEHIGEALSAVPARVKGAVSALGGTHAAPSAPAGAGEPGQAAYGTSSGRWQQEEAEGQGVGTPPHSRGRGRGEGERNILLLRSPEAEPLPLHGLKVAEEAAEGGDEAADREEEAAEGGTETAEGGEEAAEGEEEAAEGGEEAGKGP